MSRMLIAEDHDSFGPDGQPIEPIMEKYLFKVRQPDGTILRAVEGPQSGLFRVFKFSENAEKAAAERSAQLKAQGQIQHTCWVLGPGFPERPKVAIDEAEKARIAQLGGEPAGTSMNALAQQAAEAQTAGATAQAEAEAAKAEAAAEKAKREELEKELAELKKAQAPVETAAEKKKREAAEKAAAGAAK
jgi:hypothetical protein